jgi:hypothetical protein
MSGKTACTAVMAAEQVVLQLRADSLDREVDGVYRPEQGAAGRGGG